MRSKWISTIVAALMITALGLLGVGCGDDEETVNNVVEPTLPLSNERIVNEEMLGTPTQNSSFRKLYDAGSRIYFRGLIDGTHVVGELSNAGQMIWSNPQDDRVRGIYPIPGNDIGLTEGFIYVGGHSTDGDNSSEQGRIVLTGAGGAVLDELFTERADTSLWINALDRISGLKFVAVGAARVDGDENYPYLATFEVAPDSSVTILNEKIFSTSVGQYFVGAKVDPARVSGNDFAFYAAMTREDTDSEPAKQFVGGFHGSTSDVAAYGADWSVELPWVEPLNMWAYLDCIELFDGSIYVVGLGDVTKEDEPESGGYWDAGYIGSVSTAGALNWLHAVSLSNHSEGYLHLRVTSDALYATGMYGRYMKSSTGNHYGLALISVFDRMTGTEKYHLGFGGTDYYSGFYSIQLENSHAVCGGWTGYTTSDAGYQAWFTEIDLDGVGNVGASLLPNLPRLDFRATDGSNRGVAEIGDGQSGRR